MIKRIVLFCSFLCVCSAHVDAHAQSSSHEKPIVNIYMWADMIPRDVIQDFEKQTGISVVYDTFDSNDILETKLLTNHASYDVVSPSIFPYVEGQIEAGVYRPLSASLRKMVRSLDRDILALAAKADPQHVFVIPYVWGVTGFAYNESSWEKNQGNFDPKLSPTSLRVLLSQNVAQHFKDCGVSLLDEAVDVFPFALLQLGLDPNDATAENLFMAAKQIESIRPFVSRFGMYQSSRELATGELCLVQGWASDLVKARQAAAESRPAIQIKVVVPDEGASLWIDALAIPKTAPHPENAQRFIEFIMTPKYAAKISEHMGVATTHPQARRLVSSELLEDFCIYPNIQGRRFFVDRRMPRAYIQARSRYWLRIKSGLTIDTPITF